jgi:hypothetical protein
VVNIPSLVTKESDVSKDELRALQVGDRVRWTAGDSPADGTVAEKRYGIVFIHWDDGAAKMILNPQNGDDRLRARNLTKIEKESE